ncbi:MAG TPA: GNAT family N-acetyltransferase [Sphingomonas sp.]
MSTTAPSPAILVAGGLADLDEVMATMASGFDPCFGEAWSRGQCSGILPMPGVWLVLARGGDGGGAGFALARAIVDEAELLLLAVRPAMRRAGVGAALLEAVAGEARARGAIRLHLEMRENNPAIALYRGAGFGEVGRRPRYYRGNDGRSFDAITLARSLPG